jgi:hypothetical protein
MCKSDFAEEFPILYHVGKFFSSSGSKQGGLERTKSLLQVLVDQGWRVELLDLTAHRRITAAFPRTISGKRDRRATGPTLDRALKAPA